MLTSLDVARALEQGRLGGPLARGLAGLWGQVAARGVVRPLSRPAHVKLVTIGGPTLGGSGKTPLAIACARWLANRGSRVAFVGHAYRANPGEKARIVRGDDSLEEVGDEALVAAQELHDAKVPVVVGRSRQLAVTFAARLADVVVVDGLLQSSPRATLALLAVDAREPWGRAQAMPPCGDLRAPMAALLSAADRIVRIGDGPSSCDAHADSSGAWVGGHLLTWDNLAKLRVGLVTALARPDRIRRSLERRGVRPVAFVAARDHSPIEARALQAAPPVDLWIATRKCGLGARRALRQASRPSETAGAALGVLDHTLVLGLDLTRELARLDPGYLGQ